MAKTIREGSRRAIEFWLQSDQDDDGHPDTPIVLTGLQSLELRMRAKADGTVRSFKTTDGSPQLTVIDDTGQTVAPNGVLASKVQFVPGANDLLAVDVGYDCYFVLTPASGLPELIPEHEDVELFVFAKF